MGATKTLRFCSYGLVLLVAAGERGFGAIADVRVNGVTATQAIISYTAPDQNPCTIQVSENASLAPLVHDVDPAIFAGSDQDNRPGNMTGGTARVAVIGKRSAELATAGTYAGVRHFSRALEAFTAHYASIACGSDTATFTFSTSNIPLGNTYGDPWLQDPAHPGDQPWPEAVGGVQPESFIDPLTGVLLQRIGTRGQNWGYWAHMPFGTAYNQGQLPCDSGGPWSNPCSVLADDGASSSAANSTAWLVIRAPLANGNAWNAGYGSWDYGQGWTLDQLAVNIKGYVNSTTAGNRQMDVCLSLNGGASCASQIQTLTLGSKASSAAQTVGQADTSQFGILPWLLDTNPRFNVQESSPHSGRADVSLHDIRSPAGHPPTPQAVLSWTSGLPFSLYWNSGGSGRVRVSANDDACSTPPSTTTSQEFTISSFLDGTHLLVAGTPPTGNNLYWCANNFAIMVRRHQAPTDGSTAYLQYAEMAAVESTSPTYPDNGAGTACFNKLVAGGFFCLYGGLYWINPANGTSVYYGYMIAPSSRVANPWGTIGTIPAGESAVIDQTQDNFTFYNIGFDPAGGGPLVVRGVFNPASIQQPATPYANGSQIGNAAVKTANTYSISFTNGLAFTNLTPQVTAASSVAAQMAAFDPTFQAAYFKTGPNGWNCAPAAMSAGVFYFDCLSLGGDSPAWIFAFSPGDGDPTHAGQPGGPRIIGAVNSFNTPNGPVAATQTAATGRSLHAVSETGETGWVQLQMNPYPPISTSSISNIPASSSTCSSLGIPGGGECIQININSASGGGATGYEPYLAGSFRQFQFTGAPGELRTTQPGDTACVAASTVANCNWPSRANELMTLLQKNAGGQWIFRRSAYGAQLAVPQGPVTLWWMSVQSSIPPGGTTANASLAAYWSPVNGCGGAPDPHGNCLLQDTNNTSGHGEWRDGGEAVATNVPAWSRPIYGWPTDYQTAVGSVPGILGLPFGNVTPNQAAGVNYTSANPPFAGVFGIPWGFDAGSHPNAAGANAPANESIRAFDNTPVQGGSFDPVFSAVGEQLYVATPGLVTDPDDVFSSGGVASINRKLMATGASCGSHPLIDLSGPGSRIATDGSNSYSYCMARANGECLANSTAGQIYVNCPGVIWDRCTGSGIHGGTPLGVGNDICVSNIGAAANAVRQFTLDHTDFAGAFTRTLVTATSRLRMVGGFENNRLLPDNSWLLFRAEWLNYNREEMWMAKLPPYPSPDSIGRGTFVPMVLNLQPPAGVKADNAVVQFGYAEYGGNCTSRHDPCMASAAMIGSPPFLFASENPKGMPCSATCTIAIPAISQRVLYYHVSYRDKSNAVLSSTPQQAATVP
ncbi:MAG: hypothetical protein ABSH50_08950 [Bryobacteraceae bacterium]